MAIVQIKNEKITPFGGIYFVTEQFEPIERAIDEYLGRRCVSVGYQYGEIVRAMMCIFLRRRPHRGHQQSHSRTREVGAHRPAKRAQPLR